MISATLLRAESDLANGRPAQALNAIRSHLLRQSRDVHALRLLARAHDALSQPDQAEAALQRAGDLGDAEAFYLLGRRRYAAGKFRPALDAFLRSDKLNPAEPLALGGAADCLIDLDDEPGALGVLDLAIARSRDHPDAHRQYGRSLARLGRTSDAAEYLQRALDRFPNDLYLLQQATNILNATGAAGEGHLRELHVRLAGALAANASGVPSFPNTLEPDRRLRLGLLSCDFKEHSCAYFLTGVLPHVGAHDVELFFYSTTPVHDHFTERFRAMGAWRDLRTHSPGAARETILRDRPDVVLDLSGWTSLQQMSLLASRLAPVQATYLGYPNTTGLPSIDARLVDSITDPPGAESLASERLVRLDPCFLCFEPDAAWPEPAPRRPGGIVFGSFNNAIKVSDACLRAWGEVLLRVPGSRLLLKRHALTEPALRRHHATLGAMGVDPARIGTTPFTPTTREHIGQYVGIDIALDTFPYNGTTTTCEALWMGVPVITVLGEAHRSRVSASLLTAVGRPEWIADSPARMVDLAVALAGDPDQLARERASLRSAARGSALLDGPAMGARLAAAVRELWYDYCARQRPARP